MSRPDDNPAAKLSTLSVDRRAEVPIGVQLAWALRTRIGEGSLRVGERLPGVRELAEALSVNVNTVRAVYQRLEREGLIASQQGSGTFVSHIPPQADRVGSIVADAVREARAAGVDPRDVAAALYATGAPSSADGSAQAPSELARRRSLRAQIAGLERTLVELEAEHPRLRPPRARTRSAGPALLGVGALEDVRRTLLLRLAAVQAAIEGEQASPPAGSARRSQPSRRSSRAKAAAGKAASASRSRGPVRPAPAAG